MDAPQTDNNYFDTLIAVAADCPVSSSVVPEPRGGKKTVAVLQYEMLAGHPYTLRQEDVLFESWYARQPDPGDRDRRWHEFFAKSQACLRASPLPKQYGWGLHFDADGRVALLPVESAEYRALAEGGQVTVVKAMASRRGR